MTMSLYNTVYLPTQMVGSQAGEVATIWVGTLKPVSTQSYYDDIVRVVLHLSCFQNVYGNNIFNLRK